MRHHRLFSLLAATFMLTACDRDPPIVTTGLDAATAQQLFERMDRLIAALQPAAAGSAHATPAGPAGSVAPPSLANVERVALAGPELAALAARVDALERALARGAGTGAGGFHGAVRDPFAPVPRRADAAIEALAVQLHGDENTEAGQEARRAFFRMPEQQVLERLGMPTEVELGDGNRTQWNFSAGKHHVSVTIANGIVAQVSGWVDDG